MLATGVAVFDREAGAFTERVNPDLRFRSASVVKLLLALDFLWDRGPGYDVPAADRERLAQMLRASDDAAASHYWRRRGGSAILGRMVPRLGLTGTEPPPASRPGYWGYTAITAADTVRIYRYLLDEAPTPVRDVVMGHLRDAAQLANDGYDQYFGIPSAFQRPWSVKQGWSGFDPGGCTEADREASRNGGLDLIDAALHTTGTVGLDDRGIVAVLTLHAEGTPYATACAWVTRLVGRLNVPDLGTKSGD